jgi:hypothetical protein
LAIEQPDRATIDANWAAGRRDSHEFALWVAQLVHWMIAVSSLTEICRTSN